jgi:hypothetical protein
MTAIRGLVVDATSLAVLLVGAPHQVMIEALYWLSIAGASVHLVERVKPRQV